MVTTWAIGSDWNRDGFICWDARPGDMLNLLPTPLTMTNLTWRTNSASSVSLIHTQSSYGIKAFRVEAQSAYHGLVIGETNAGVVQGIPVQPSTTYRMTVWVRGIANYAGIPLYMNAYDEDGTWLDAITNINLTADWQKISWPFTTAAGSQYVRIALALNQAAPSPVTFEATGLMLVQGSSTPNGFNAGAASDLYDNLTDRVMSSEWFLGVRGAYREVADDSTLEVILNNSDKRFSPENGSSPLYGKLEPFKPIHIRSVSDITRTHWVGWLERVVPETGQYGERTASIIATGPLQFLRAAETKLKLQENKRTDEIIDQLLQEVVIPPALSRAWILGRTTNSELGSSTYLGDTTAYSVLDAGTVTIAMAADNWVREGGYTDAVQDTFDVHRAISEITAAEHGKFLFDRTGKALFWNRHHLLRGAAVAATFDDTMIDLNYTYAGTDQCKNEVIVIAHPRKISATATEVLWELDDAVVQVEVGNPRSFYIKYKDDEKTRVGAKDVTVGDLEFEQGTATVTIVAKANGGELTFTNTGTKTAIVKKCKVKGRKITDSGRLEAKAISQGSIIDFGRRTLRLNLPSIDNLEDAQYIADFERNRRSQPRGEVAALTVASHGMNGGTHHAHQLTCTLGALIQVQEEQTGHDKYYYIVGETHQLTEGTTLWKTIWYLEPAPERYPWKLGATGRSELETDVMYLTY